MINKRKFLILGMILFSFNTCSRNVSSNNDLASTGIVNSEIAIVSEPEQEKIADSTDTIELLEEVVVQSIPETVSTIESEKTKQTEIVETKIEKESSNNEVNTTKASAPVTQIPNENATSSKIIKSNIPVANDFAFQFYNDGNMYFTGKADNYKIRIFGTVPFRHIMITGYDGNDKDIVIPEFIDGIPIQDSLVEGETCRATVIYIGVEAFRGKGLVSVVFPESIIYIAKGAFYQNKIREINIPNSVETIDEWVFAENEITKIIIPDNLDEISQAAFFRNKLTEIIIPDSIKKIGDWAFADSELESIKIGDNVMFNRNAFKNNFYTAYGKNNGGYYSTFTTEIDGETKSYWIWSETE